MKNFVSFLLLAALLAGCSSASSQIEAENVMRAFFHALAGGDYETAANLYDGEYETLVQMNPSISPADHVALWQSGCERNGFVCMEVLDVLSVTEGDTQIEFKVSFKTKDGEQFEFTGCCGETLPEPITEFTVLVQADDTYDFKILSLPPYVP